MDLEDNNPFGASDVENAEASVPNTAPASAPAGHTISISGVSKVRDGGSRSHIAYTIRHGTLTVRRRYSDFESLQQLLRQLYPCVVIPPIPEKHSLSAYAINPTHAKEDASVIEHRQRALARFLNRCAEIPLIRDSSVFQEFFNPNTTFRDIVAAAHDRGLPPPLQAPPQAPPQPPPHAPPEDLAVGNDTPESESQNSNTASMNKVPSSAFDAEPARAYLPLSVVLEPGEDDASAAQLKEASIKLAKRARRISKHYSRLAAEYADFGGQLNSFSLDTSGQFERFAPAVEKVGQAVDGGYLTCAQLVESLDSVFVQPVVDEAQLALAARQVVQYGRQRSAQVELLKADLNRLETDLATLKPADSISETEAQPRSTQRPPSDSRGRGAAKLMSALYGIMDGDPQASRHSMLARTQEDIERKTDALQIAEKDAQQAAELVEEETARWEAARQTEVRALVRAFLDCHIEWAKRNLRNWELAKQAISNS